MHSRAPILCSISGITGDVNIDENGDRIADYSLLDMDPETSRFEVRHRREERRNFMQSNRRSKKTRHNLISSLVMAKMKQVNLVHDEMWDDVGAFNRAWIEYRNLEQLAILPSYFTFFFLFCAVFALYVWNHFSQIVANYYGANKTLEYIPGKKIHWAGGRLKPPPDTPTCGFDGSLCPDNCELPISI